MDLTSILIQAVSGAVGGNAVGSVAKDNSLGPIGNTIAGAIGGAVGGPLLAQIIGLASSGLDFGAIVQGFLTGGVSGALLAFVAGFLKAKFA